MIALDFRFPAGRYHATPWGRHVNEADVAWPPDPWRLLRTLVATWHRKADHRAFPEEHLSALIEALAEPLPSYRLPEAIHAHSRHFMPLYDGNRTLIFDAFTRLNPKDPLTVVWPDLELPDDALALLDHLVERIGYLGRAESWVEAERRSDRPDDLHAWPSDQEISQETGEVGVLVSLLAALTPAEYQIQRAHWLGKDHLQDRKKADARLLATTLGPRLLDALSVDTADLRKAGWSQPPASRTILYRRPVIGPLFRRAKAVAAEPRDRVTTARFALARKPLPRIEDAVRIGELVRRAVMAKAKAHFGADAIPAVLSGHGSKRDDRHGHAFFLSEGNEDGVIDHVIIHARDGFGPEVRQTLNRLTKLFDGGYGDWPLLLEFMGPVAAPAHPSPLLRSSAIWVSATPYLHPWYAKKGFGAAEQIRRECTQRGLPTPVMIEPLDSIRIKGRDRRPIHFHRFRSKRGLTQPDSQGSFWRLTFPEPFTGPLALGFGCHFGLGLFKPDKTGHTD